MRLCMLVLAAVALGAEEKERPSLLEWAKASTSRSAYGIYVKGKKVGWSVDEIKLGKAGGKDVLVATSESFMQTLFDGEKSTKRDRTTYHYALDGDGPMVYALVWKEEDGKEMTRVARPAGKGLKVVTKQDGRTSERSVPLPKDTLAAQRKLEDWLGGERKAGDTHVKWSASWDEAEVDQKEAYTYESAKEVALAGVKTRLLSVQVASDGAKLPAVVFPDGKVYSAEVGGLLSLKLESEKVAKAVDEKLVDLLTATSVPLDRDLGRSGREVDSLKLELSDVGDFAVPASHRQKVTAGKDAATVELRRDFRLGEAAGLTKEERKRWTEATPRIQSEEEAIRERAKAVVGDEADAGKRARALARWVFRTLKKSYADNADTATQVLDRKAGDCTEHSLLFVALCRSLGIPAREVGGLAYARMSKPLLGWHAWAEIHDGHQWVSVDPTWDQFYVDGTHLKLSEGDKDDAWTNLVGRVKVKVVTFARRK